MKIDSKTIESVASILHRRRRYAAPRVEAQLDLLNMEKFIDLVWLAGLIPERGESLGYAKSHEARYLHQQLGKQISEMICELVRHHEDVEDVEPMHRLPAISKVKASNDGRDAEGPDAGPAAQALQRVFPSRLDGWLTIPRGVAGTKARERRNTRGSIRTRRSQDIPPARAFESALRANPDAIETHLETFLESLYRSNGVLPIVVRNNEQQKHLRDLEFYQIDVGFREAGKTDLIDRGKLRQLCELIIALEAPGDMSDDGFGVGTPADRDQSLPLASLWSLALRAFTTLQLTGDRSRADRVFRDGDRECHPGLTTSHLEGLEIKLSAAEVHSTISLLRVHPPNSFVEIFDKQTILSHRRGRGPLKDWLVGVKDVFAFGPTTAGSSILDPFTSQFEATAVRRLRGAGCLLVGKTNLDEFALGSSCETSAFKPTPGCPIDRLRVAGGSSGGSASAVAAGLVRIALGSDTAGSIRVPAAYCGVVGWKPSYGVVSRNGLLSLSSGLDVVGLLTRNVDDCIAAASVMIGEDMADESTAGAVGVDAQSIQSACADTESLNVGVPIEYFINVARPLLPLYRALIGTQNWDGLRDFPNQMAVHSIAGSSIATDVPGALDDRFRTIPDYWDIFRRILDQITALGWNWRLVSLPHTWLSIPAYFAFSRAELASSLHRYDGTAFGARSRCDFSHLASRRRQSLTRCEHFGIQPKLRILMGIHALQLPLAIKRKRTDHPESGDCFLDDFLELAKMARQAIYKDFIRAFNEIDVLLTPVVNVAAPPYGGIVDTIAQQRLDEFTVPADHAGVPAISLPWGTIRSFDDPLSEASDWEGAPRLPTAVQVITRRFEDVRLLAVAKRLEGLRDEMIVEAP